MAELQRANPQSAKQTGVAFNTPDTRGQLASLEASSKALSLQEQGKQNIARSLRGLAEGVEHLGGVAATVSANEAKQTMEMATRLDMQSYTLALGEAQRRAQEEFSSHTYGTAEEAATAYRNTVGKYISEVDNLFFPADENDRVAGNYFRYADALGLTPDHPMMQMAKQQTEAAGTNYALNKWNEEDMAINASIGKRACETWVAARCEDEDIYYKIIEDTMGNQFVNKATIRQMAKQFVVMAKSGAVGDAMGVTIKNVVPWYQEKLQVMLAEGKDFDEAQTLTREQIIDEANGFIDRDIDLYLKEKDIGESDRKWAENLRKSAKADVLTQLKGVQKDAKELHRANLNKYMNAAPGEINKVSPCDTELVNAFNAENVYEKEKEKYGSREVLLDKASGTEVNLGVDKEGNPVDVTEAVADSMVITLSKLTYDSNGDYKIATRILKEAAHLEPELHQQIKQVFLSGLDFATNASPERKKEKQSIDITVERFMGEMGINPKYKAIKDMTGDNQKLACALCAAIEGVPVSQRRPVLEAAYHAYKMETWNKLNAWNAWNDFMFTFGEEIPQEPTLWQRAKNALNAFGKAGGGNEVIKNVSGAGDPLNR